MMNRSKIILFFNLLFFISILVFRCLSSVTTSDVLIATCSIKSNAYNILIYEVIFIKSIFKENISYFFLKCGSDFPFLVIIMDKSVYVYAETWN